MISAQIYTSTDNMLIESNTHNEDLRSNISPLLRVKVQLNLDPRNLLIKLCLRRDNFYSL